MWNENVFEFNIQKSSRCHLRALNLIYLISNLIDFVLVTSINRRAAKIWCAITKMTITVTNNNNSFLSYKFVILNCLKTFLKLVYLTPLIFLHVSCTLILTIHSHKCSFLASHVNWLWCVFVFSIRWLYPWSNGIGCGECCSRTNSNLTQVQRKPKLSYRLVTLQHYIGYDWIK